MKISTQIFIAGVSMGLLLLGAILYSTLDYLSYFGLFFLALLGLFGMCWLTLTGLVGWEKLNGIKAERRVLEAKVKQAEYEANRKRYQTKKDGHGMLHLLDVDTGHSQNLTIDSRAYRNGHYEEPKASEQYNYALIMAKSSKQIEQAGQLTIEQKPELDLLKILTQPTQSYAIIAGQQVGKTFQARRIAQYWLQSGYQPIVIGPKWDKDEWQECTLFGGGYNFEQVARGMRIVHKLAEDRHADKNLSHKDHPIQPVFFDDWTGIKAKFDKEAEDFIVEATTFYASVNIILYFMLHADTANAWGVGKVGAALKNNFIKLMIEPDYDSAGLIDRSRNTGFIIYPGKTIKDKVQVRLFGGTGQVALLPDLVLQPTKQDADSYFVELVQSGKSRNESSLEAYGRRYAGDLVERGKKALGEI